MELMKRLRKLEGIVEELSGQIEVEARNPSNAASPEEHMENPQEKESNRDSSGAPLPGMIRSSTVPNVSGDRLANPSNSTKWAPLATSAAHTTKVMSSDMSRMMLRDNGRLLLNDIGKTRYVSSAFWSKINDELDQLRAETQKLTDDDTDDTDEDESSSAAGPQFHSTVQGDHHAFIFGYRSSDVDLRKLHPLPSQIPFIWQVYCENVDPVAKILHVPTMDNAIRKLRTDMDRISPGMEALMFSIYYGAIISLDEDEIKMNFNAEKSELIKRYRFGTEQALSKANFLTTSDLEVVQAFTTYLLLARKDDNTRFSWSLTGLLIRISQMIGIHREGTHFSNLSPFDIEMRRRLWWAICVLDLRAAEDQGTDLTIAERTYDTQFPMNINDSDITPEMKHFPPARTGTTDMTFSLLRYEILSLARKLYVAASVMAPCPKDAMLSMDERERLLLAMKDGVEEKYLRHCAAKDSSLLHWVAALIARLILAKMSLIAYQPMLFPPPGQEVSQKARDRLFQSSTEAVEYSKILMDEPKCKQFRWLFQVYTQWHVVAYILVEVCHRPWSGAVERAWMTLNETFQTPKLEAVEKMTNSTAILIPIRKLMLKAKRHREAEIARLRADPEAAKELDEAEGNGPAPAGLHNLPSSIRNAAAHERWRKLVGRPAKANPRPRQGTSSSTATTAPTPAPAAFPNQLTNEQPGLSQEQMNFVSDVISQQHFNPSEFWLAAFQSGGDPKEMTRLAIAGIPSDAASQYQQQPAMPAISNNDSPMTMTNSGGLCSTGAIQGGTSPSDPVDNNPPPWLWSGTWNWGDANATANVPTSGDVDVNMDVDEDFDWQDWQQNLRAFEMDGIAMPNSVFPSGI